MKTIWQRMDAAVANGGPAWLLPPSALTGSAAPLKPPADWFADPKLEGPTPLTVTDDGQVFGHLALWDACHTGYRQSRCVAPPRSKAGYRFFHVGQLELSDGSRVAVGPLTVGGGHASLSMGASAARDYYDQVGKVGAFVRAGEDEHGIWVAGALKSDVTPEVRRDLMANPLSGDWRTERGSLELIGACTVVSPGFPVLRASAGDDERSLILTCAGLSRSTEVAKALGYLRPARRPALVAAAAKPARSAVLTVRRPRVLTVAEQSAQFDALLEELQ